MAKFFKRNETARQAKQAEKELRRAKESDNFAARNNEEYRLVLRPTPEEVTQREEQLERFAGKLAIMTNFNRVLMRGDERNEQTETAVRKLQAEFARAGKKLGSVAVTVIPSSDYPISSAKDLHPAFTGQGIAVIGEADGLIEKHDGKHGFNRHTLSEALTNAERVTTEADVAIDALVVILSGTNIPQAGTDHSPLALYNNPQFHDFRDLDYQAMLGGEVAMFDGHTNGDQQWRQL